MCDIMHRSSRYSWVYDGIDIDAVGSVGFAVMINASSALSTARVQQCSARAKFFACQVLICRTTCIVMTQLRV